MSNTWTPVRESVTKYSKATESIDLVSYYLNGRSAVMDLKLVGNNRWEMVETKVIQFLTGCGTCSPNNLSALQILWRFSGNYLSKIIGHAAKLKK